MSPGVAVGTAYCIHEVFVDPDTTTISDSEINAELTRYENARSQAIAELGALENKVKTQVGNEAAAIFAVHQSILRDPTFIKKMKHWIATERLSAQAGLQRLLSEYASLFARTRDEYLQERFHDIRDVVERLSAHLSPVMQPDQDVLQGPLIVVADELLPSQVVALGDADVHGIVTQAGSQTSHAAIIARSRGIPAVSGVTRILNTVKTGDSIIVDGREGHVITRPDAETLAAYRKLEREFVDLKDQLAENRDQPAVTADDVPLSLEANINSLVDAEAAMAMGASGVGLYRTEYLYLTHPSVPDEQEQFETYRDIIAAAPDHRVTIRTLDIGGDKTVPYLGHSHQEANPFMGWRSLRLSFEHPEFFITQIRAVMRAAAAVESNHVSLMFPMVTTVDEMRRVRAIVRRAFKQLSENNIPFGRVEIGMMLEVPAAAISIDHLLEVADFVSIGSNDLVQYLMAADRDNPKVSGLCQPLAPAVLRVLQSVITKCNQANRRVTVCGEMAGQPDAFVLLLGMGLRRFSMSPAFIPSIKQLASQVSFAEAQGILAEALRRKTTPEIKRLLARELNRLAPNLSLLQTK